MMRFRPLGRRDASPASGFREFSGGEGAHRCLRFDAMRAKASAVPSNCPADQSKKLSDYHVTSFSFHWSTGQDVDCSLKITMVTHRRQVFVPPTLGAYLTSPVQQARGNGMHISSRVSLSRYNSMDQLRPKQTERRPESFHSCQLCPPLKLDVAVSSTVIFPFTKVILSARDGCEFFRERLKRIFPPSSWVFEGNVGQLLDDSSIRTLDKTLSLHIRTSLDGHGLCFVDCDFGLPNGAWDEENDDTLLGWVSKGKLRLAAPTTKG